MSLGASAFRNLRLVLIPCAVAAVLAAPCFRFPFLWDDFDFLGRGLHLHLSDLLPVPQTLFYRPISREIYFGLLNVLGGSPLIGHILNTLGLLAVVYLLVSIVSRMGGSRVGFLTGLVFASLGALPVLVGWVSGIQDILAMAMLLAAVLMELRGRDKLALSFFAAALLSKETALTFVPALLAASAIGSRIKWPRLRRLVSYGAIALAWAAIHPGIQLLLSRGIRGGSGGYLATPSSGNLSGLANAALTLVNLPLGPGSSVDLSGLALPLALAAGLVWVGYRLAHPRESESLLLPETGRGAQLLLACLMTVPPFLLTGLFVEHWSPYYTCMAALGFSMLAGIGLSSLRLQEACMLVSVYLLLGGWSRTATVAADVTTEKNLRETGIALTRVEEGFRRLRPKLPARSNVYVSAQISGTPGVYSHLYRYQPLRVWYRDPSLLVLKPNRYRPGSDPTFLFWINRTLHVFEVDLGTLAPRTSRVLADPLEYELTLRTFAFGLAAAGRVDDAVTILVWMPGRRPELIQYGRRAAAALLIAAGRTVEAANLLVGIPPLGRVEARNEIMSMIAEATPELPLDDAAMQAFGIGPRDLDMNRTLMQTLNRYGYEDAAVRFAARVLALEPGSEDALQIIQKWTISKAQPQVTVPIPHG
ncbi:MAG: hypothetical protein ACRENN_03350 [Candidatus Eiseniibacteriota bacterium]